MQTIKAVIFDLDDTLYDFDTVHKEATKKLNQKAYELLGVDPALFDRIYHDAFRGVMQRMGTTVETGSSHSRTLRLQYTLEELGKPIFPNVLLLYDVYWGYILDHMQPEPYIKEALSYLQDKGYTIGCGTNMTAHIQYQKIERLGLGQYFTFMMTSEESVIDKPSKTFFDMAVSKAGCPADRCVFIGDDHGRDYEGALNAGLNAIWYNRKVKPEKGEKVIHSHRELIDIL